MYFAIPRNHVSEKMCDARICQLRKANTRPASCRIQPDS